METSQRFGAELFWQQTAGILEHVMQTQLPAIRMAAQLFIECIEDNGIIHAFGSGHSRAFAMELAGRAGGLAPVNRLDLEDLALRSHWPLEVVKSPDIERNAQAGRVLLSCYQIAAHDVFIISSNSGVNAAIVELAQQIKRREYKLVAVTSLEHTQQVASRHSSGKKLYEFADVVIDSCVPAGDALLPLPQGGLACAVSSLTGALIAQTLTAETIAGLIARGQDVPVYISANVPGGIEHNDELVQRYAGRVHF
jgi:uncharacterized phosphosugar-binding protein